MLLFPHHLSSNLTLWPVLWIDRMGLGDILLQIQVFCSINGNDVPDLDGFCKVVVLVSKQLSIITDLMFSMKQ